MDEDTDNTDDGTQPTEGQQYRHPDGTVEVVFALEGGRVLTLREYPTRDRFERAVDAATDTGIKEHVATLPDVDEFADDGGTGDSNE